MYTEPAFPVLPHGDNTVDHQGYKVFAGYGMTLLDYFAAKAMQGFLSAPSDVTSQDSGPNARANPSMMAEWAYQCAEAMYLERKKNLK